MYYKSMVIKKKNCRMQWSKYLIDFITNENVAAG